MFYFEALSLQNSKVELENRAACTYVHVIPRMYVFINIIVFLVL